MGSSRNPINSMAAIKKGSPGDSAYIIAAKHGFVGTEEQWLASLKGEPGSPGQPGADGTGSGTGNSYMPGGW